MNSKNLILLVLPFLIIFGCQKKLDIPDHSTQLKTEKKNIVPNGFFIENLKVPGVASANNAFANRTSTANTTIHQNSASDPDNGYVRTLPAFRDRLLQQNGNNQAAAVTNLFAEYGY